MTQVVSMATVASFERMKFPEKLVLLLSKAGKSQSKLARETGLSQSSISEMTLGRRRPYMDQAFLLAHALGVSLDFLADDDQDVPPQEAGRTQEQAVLLTYRASGLSAEEAIRALVTAARLSEPAVEVNPADRIRAVRPEAKDQAAG